VEKNATFDSVRIWEGGEWRDMSADSFFALPLSLRIRHIIGRKVVFLKQGKPVEQKAALAEVRRARAPHDV
jgi:hypothetical protein